MFTLRHVIVSKIVYDFMTLAKLFRKISSLDEAHGKSASLTLIGISHYY